MAPGFLPLVLSLTHLEGFVVSTCIRFCSCTVIFFITGWDGCLHIVPALSLVDPTSVTDQSWNPLDLTTFPAVTSSPPKCCVWWQSTALGHQVLYDAFQQLSGMFVSPFL